MINLFELLAKQFASSATKDIGRSVEAVASGDVKKIAGAAYDTFAPLPVQAALYSPEAEAAFIGPKGMARLKGTEFEKLMKPFISRFFGQRAELNPTDSDLVIQAMMGGPHAIAKAQSVANKEWADKVAARNLREDLETNPFGPSRAQNTIRTELFNQDKAKLMAEKPKDLVAADFLEHFPALVAAYPELKKVPIHIRSNYYGNEIAKFEPNFSVARSNTYVPFPIITAKVLDKVAPYPDLQGFVKYSDPINKRGSYMDYKEYDKAADAVSKKRRAIVDAHIANYRKREAKNREQAELDANVGKITVSLPDQAIGDYPGLTSYESILHEIQHFIQKQESGLIGRDFLTDYKRPDNKLRSDIVTAAEKKATDSRGYTDVRKLNWGQGLKVHSYDNDVSIPDEYLYKMNPFEREAFEASKRDITPAYRDAYSRITELIKKEVKK